MWKAAVFVFLLLNMFMQANGAADKTRTSAAENSRPEKNVKTEEGQGSNTVPASGTASSAFLGKLLVVPMDGSHWVGVKALAQEMGRRGHRVTVVIPEVSIRMGPGKHYETVTYPVPYDKAYVDSVMASHIDVIKKTAQSFTEKIKNRFAQIQKITSLIHTGAESLLFNDSLISHLAQQVSPTITDLNTRSGPCVKANKIQYSLDLYTEFMRHIAIRLCLLLLNYSLWLFLHWIALFSYLFMLLCTAPYIITEAIVSYLGERKYPVTDHNII